MGTFAGNRPVIFAVIVTIVWSVLLLVFMGVASSVFRKPYGDAATDTAGRLAVTVCVLLLVWRLGWLEASGVARLGSWQVWLLALGGMIAFASASLYAFYGRASLDVSSLMRSPKSSITVLTVFAVGLSEELLFRGLLLYALTRVWGESTRGIVGSVVLTSLLFAVLHITQVFTHGTPLSSALVLTLQATAISIWWGALVLLGGSIWPVVMWHFVVNAVVAVQGLTVTIIEPEILAYRRLLWFSIPLVVIGIGLLILAGPQVVVTEAPQPTVQQL
jgi:membrane protease YdiL (CAAX protease family)